MSTKVWAYNAELDKIQHISEIDKSYKGKMYCLDDNCKSELTICIGSKNQPYFAHKSSTSCKGTKTKEGILRLLCMQVLRECKKFTLPDEFVIFRNQRVLLSCERTILISEVLPFETLGSDFRTGVSLKDWEGNTVYVELVQSEGIASSRLKAYNSRGCTVVKIDLSKFRRNLDDVNFDDIREFVFGSSLAKSYIVSPSISKINEEIKRSLYKSNGEKILCPARSFEAVVESKKCQNCPYFDKYDSTDKSVICYGKGCYSSASDFGNTSRLDLRRERYSHKLPEPVWGVDKTTYMAYFGRCPECHGKYIIGQGTQGEKLYGLAVVEKENDKYVYKVCRDCGHYEKILCPSCHRPMVLRRNHRNGSIFAGCTGYSGRGIGERYSCNTCISLFEDEPCMDNIHEDIKLVGSLDLFLSEPSKARARIRASKRKVE